MPSQSAARCSVLALFVVFISTFAATALAAVPVHVVHTDLKSAIRAGVQSPVQFAVLVPHTVSVSSGGSWSTAGELATWSYAVQVPTAVSLSFHATAVSLPRSATLVVRGARSTTSYTARAVHNGELWSRIQPGDALQMTLSVAAADRDRVRLEIVSLQAGYRSLGPGVEDHPYYRQLQAQQVVASDNTSCVTNYECKVAAANMPAGSATMAVVVENQFQCTGTLINDVPGDNTPYVLTARHCESGQVGLPGKPAVAAGTTFYWDAASGCAAGLGSIYDPGIPAQTGAQTIVEQQDLWLMQLDATPVVTDAQFAGFDASGAAVQGGYTIHHAEGNDKQFTAWFGQAAKEELNTPLTMFLETVNQTGNIGPGASGSALIDQNNHLVGSLTYGRVTSDPSGYGSCPLSPPPAPDGTNGVADFTALAALWTATGDANSTTGAVALKSVLDPGNTGTLVVASIPALSIDFSAPVESASIGVQIALSWSALNASQCTATGGAAGDGWTGTLAASGSQTVTETALGTVAYSLSCAFPGGRTARASVSITWVGPAPVVQFSPSRSALWTTRPVTLTWSSNTSPCSITGGSTALTNLAASGTTTATEATPGDVTYVITCGPANNSVRQSLDVTFATPSLVLQANSTDRLAGQPLILGWTSYADQCTPSGGASGDGWSNSEFFASQTFAWNATAPGIYTYTLTCSSGPLSVQQAVQVLVENNPPFTNASVDRSTVTLTDAPSDYMTLSWVSNLTSCSVNSQPYLSTAATSPQDLLGAPQPQDSITFSPSSSGTYVVSVTCTAQLNANVTATSTPITLTVQPPAPPTATITFTPNPVLIGQNFTVTWSSTDTSYCSTIGTQGLPGDFWLPGGRIPVAGQATGYFPNPLQGTVGISCPSIDPNQAAATAQVAFDVQGPEVTLTASPTSVTPGGSFTLTWSSSATSGCTAAGGPWTGETLATSGSQTLTAGEQGGSSVYSINCTGEGETVGAQVTVNVSAPSSGGNSSSGGGGGAMSWLELALLAALPTLRRRATALRKSAA